VALRPYDVEKRNEFYAKENYHKKENELIRKISELYESNELSERCRKNFEILLRILELHNSVKYSSLKELNADVTQKFTALKQKTIYDLLISNCKKYRRT
jgi:hypothetical protein